jgi:hypothetical protein
MHSLWRGKILIEACYEQQGTRPWPWQYPQGIPEKKSCDTKRPLGYIDLYDNIMGILNHIQRAITQSACSPISIQDS